VRERRAGGDGMCGSVRLEAAGREGASGAAEGSTCGL
jgi:hypothetical protein